VSLTTRCPRCKTLFRVTPAQLETRAGQVRCGRCMNVFNGFASLAPGQPDAAAADAPAAHTGPAVAAAGAAAAASPAPKAAPAAAAPPLAAAQTAAPDPFAEQKPPLAERLRQGAAAAKAQYVRKPTAEGRRVLACVLLAVLLAGQLTYVFRSQIAARYPAVRAALTKGCELAGCTVTLPQRPDLVKIEASDVHMIDPGRPALIQLTATLRSYANYDLAYPALDLVLTNANEHALARRIFKPEEYLDQTRDAKAGIPPRAEITLALDLDTGDLKAAGFRLDLMAAPAP